MADPFNALWTKLQASIAEAEKRTVDAKAEGCQHANLPVKYDAEDCAGKSADYVRVHYPRFYGECPDCGERMIGHASFEHFVAGDW